MNRLAEERFQCVLDSIANFVQNGPQNRAPLGGILGLVRRHEYAVLYCTGHRADELIRAW